MNYIEIYSICGNKTILSYDTVVDMEKDKEKINFILKNDYAKWIILQENSNEINVNLNHVTKVVYKIEE
jgi:hypothetical protein